MIEIRDQARNKWASILQMFGIDRDYLKNKHGPCPICGGKDRFRFDDKDGTGSWFCSSCGAGDGIALLMLHTKQSFAECASEVRACLGEARETKPRPDISPERAREAMVDLWRGSRAIADDEAGAYLVSRGFAAPFPGTLRFHPAAPVSGHPSRSTMPAMLAKVTGPNGDGVNIHRTYLEGGRKAKSIEPRKLMPGRLPDGSTIRLYGHNGILGIAEGIETAMAAMRQFDVPCWSAINATNLAKFAPPHGLRELVIFADNDPKFGGHAAAYALAHKVACRPDAPLVSVKVPDLVGTDWADAA